MSGEVASPLGAVVNDQAYDLQQGFFNGAH
jgi:hypothetical protein